MKRMILTTDVEGFTYDEYLDYCEANGFKAAEEESSAFYEWAQEEVDINYESDMDNIVNFGPYNVPVLITGELGLWNGRHEIVPVEKDSVAAAIEACFGRSINDINVEWIDGEIIVHAYHHDGTNVFTINAKDGGNLPYLYE